MLRSVQSLLASLLIVASSLAAAADEIPVRIVQHFGTNSAPLTVMREQRLIEKRLPNARVEYRKLSGGSDTVDAFLSDQIDFSAMGIAPFLTAWAKGVPIGVVSGLVNGPVKLMTWREDIRSIKDFQPNDRIAVPSLSSAQAMMLRMAAAKEFGDPKRLDKLLVSLPHPEAMNALLSKQQVTAHFATPPYLDQESAAGMKLVLDSVDAVGEPYSGQIMVASSKFRQRYPQGYRAVSEALDEAVRWISAHPREAAELIHKADNYKMTVDALQKAMTGDNAYNTKPLGVMRFANFMFEQGLIKKKPANIAEVQWR